MCVPVHDGVTDILRQADLLRLGDLRRVPVDARRDAHRQLSAVFLRGLNGHGGNMKTIEKLGLEFEEKGCLVAMLNWWLMVWDMNPAWKGGHGGGEETAAIMGIDPSLIDRNEIGGPLKLFDLTENLKATGFRSVEYKGVSVEILRSTPHVTDSGWIGPDHPNTATEEWGREMLRTCADYIVDFMEEFKKAPLSQEK